jgi:hypothetical protein
MDAMMRGGLPFSKDDIFVMQTTKWKQGVTGWHHYNTFWVL